MDEWRFPRSGGQRYPSEVDAGGMPRHSHTLTFVGLAVLAWLGPISSAAERTAGRGDAGEHQVLMVAPEPGRVVSGLVNWTAQVPGSAPARVDFLVDGRVEWTEFYRPYTFSGDGGTWNTLKVKNGEHVLAVRIRGQNGSEALHRTLVEVRNPDPEQEPAAGEETLAHSFGGTVWNSGLSGVPVNKVNETFYDVRYAFGGGAAWAVGTNGTILKTTTHHLFPATSGQPRVPASATR